MSLWSNINSALTELQGAGFTATQAATAVSTIFGNVANTVNPMLATIIGNYADQAVVKDEVTKIKEVPNLPATVPPLLDVLVSQTGNLVAMIQTETAIKQLL